MNKVVITGFGLVSPLGSRIDEAVAAIRRGQAGARAPVRQEGEPYHLSVQQFNPADYVDKKKVRRMDPVNCFVIAATRLALEMAGLDSAAREQCGIIVGTGFAGFSSVVKHQQKFLSEGIGQLSPIHFPTTVYNASAGLAAIELGLKGVNSTVTGLDLAGEYAVLYGCMLLRNGMARQVVVVGADELSPALLEGFRDLGFISRGQPPAVPYSQSRDGFIAAEGAGALVLELETTARARAAPLLGVLEGIGVCASADKMFGYSDDPGAPVTAIRQALAQAGRQLEDIDWVSCAANGTYGLDRCEAEAIGHLLDKQAAVALKTYSGEYAASGTLRIGLALACARAGFVPPMPADQDYEPAIAAHLNPDGNRASGRYFLHHGMGVGGNNVTFVIASQQEEQHGTESR